MHQEELDEQEELRQVLENDLLRLYGPVLTGQALRQVLGYQSKDSFRQGVTRKTVPVPLFEIEHRRGKFALAKDIAAFLARQRFKSMSGGSNGR